MNLAKISWKLVAAILVICVIMTAFAFMEHYHGVIVYSLLALMLILTVLLIFITMISRKTAADLRYDGLHVRGAMLHIKVPYGNIHSTELRDGGGRFDYGIRIGGYGGIDRLGGNFRNKEFGNYKLSVKISVQSCIVVRHGDNKVLVFNLETAEETVKFHGELKRTVGK